MNKIYMKDIRNICSCISSLSCQTIRSNKKGCYNHNIITSYYIKPYNCKEVNFLFYKNNYAMIITSDNKKEMYIKLLELYKRGLNNWIELYNNDRFKNKREKKRMNYYINKLNEFERLLND